MCNSDPMTTSGQGARITPTAHYTGHTWVHHGMSDRHLDTTTGRLLHQGLRPLDMTLSFLGQPTVDGFLVARHRLIDAELRRAIDAGVVSQIIEVACGLSPRGLVFSRDYADRITYVEADLPGMADLKRRRLAAASSLGENHRVVELDALATDGPNSILEVARGLDPTRGTAIVTEGLINYFDRATAQSMFERFAAALNGFPNGLFLTDVYLRDYVGHPLVRFFTMGLSLFVRGRVHVFDDTVEEMARAVESAGFSNAEVLDVGGHPAVGDLSNDRGASIVRVVRATT